MPVEEFVRQLAVVIDEKHAHSWDATCSFLLLLRSSTEDEYLEMKTLEIDGHPSDTLRLIPPDDRYIAACLSSLGHLSDFSSPSAPKRLRVRITTAVSPAGDLSIVRDRRGSLQELEGMTGETGELLKELFTT